MDPTRVLLVEDHPLLQQVIQASLAPHCTVIAVLDRAEHVADTIHALHPEVLVLDVSLPGRSGMQILPEIREQFPALGIVIATNHTEPIYQTEAFRRGADVFVVKNRLQEELWPAVQEARSTRQASSRSCVSRQA